MVEDRHPMNGQFAAEREVAGDDGAECRWCGALPNQRCGQTDDYYVPSCVINGTRELEEDEE